MIRLAHFATRSSATEAEMILFALRHFHGPGAVTTFPREPPDPDRLAEFARRHRLLPTISDALCALPADFPGRDAMVLMFTAMRMQNERRNSALNAELLDIVAKLANAGIDTVCLKGAAFLAENPPAAWRFMVDLDVLVPPGQIAEAGRILLADGYEALMPLSGFRAGDHQHFPPLAKPDSPGTIELHSRLIWDPDRDPVPPERIFAAAVKLPGKGITIKAPSAEHRIAHLIAHGQIQDRRHAARTVLLRDLADLSAICAPKAPDWQAVEDMFRAIRRHQEFAGFMAIAAEILGPPIEVPQSCADGRKWAAHARQSLIRADAGRWRFAIATLTEYVWRVAMRQDGWRIAGSILSDRGRRNRFFRGLAERIGR